MHERKITIEHQSIAARGSSKDAQELAMLLKLANHIKENGALIENRTLSGVVTDFKNELNMFGDLTGQGVRYTGNGLAACGINRETGEAMVATAADGIAWRGHIPHHDDSKTLATEIEGCSRFVRGVFIVGSVSLVGLCAAPFVYNRVNTQINAPLVIPPATAPVDAETVQRINAINAPWSQLVCQQVSDVWDAQVMEGNLREQSKSKGIRRVIVIQPGPQVCFSDEKK